MVRNVIDVIEEKCEQGRFPNEFRDRLHKNSRTFEEALNVTENYIKEGNLFVPDRINISGEDYQHQSYNKAATFAD